jgi:hypothetical protein
MQGIAMGTILPTDLEFANPLSASLVQSFVDKEVAMDPLDSDAITNLRVAAPCPAAWDKMQGDAQVRFCSLCSKNVYNISALSRAEAENLIRSSKEGRLCVRFYQRSDGTVLTDNCPVGLRSIRRRLKWMASGVAALLAFGAAAAPAAFPGLLSFPRKAAAAARHAPLFSTLQNHEPFQTLFDWADPPSCLMGKPASPPPVLPPPPPPPAGQSGSANGNQNVSPTAPNATPQ